MPFTSDTTVCKQYSDLRENTIFDKEYGDNYNLEEESYESLIDNGGNICLNCTYWNVSPYGSAYGMVCDRDYPTDGPADSCNDFIQSH